MKTIILDFDGTIADTSECICATVESAMQAMNLPVPGRENICQLIGLPLRETFVRSTGISDESTIDEYVRVYRKKFDYFADRTVNLFPHVKETLALLHTQGVTLTVASSRGRGSLINFLQRFEIAGYISIVLGEQDVVHKKPAPDMVLHILEQTQTLPKDALVVGDTTYDILMGQNAHCPTCGVTYGNHSRLQLEEQHADHIISDFAELYNILQG